MSAAQTKGVSNDAKQEVRLSRFGGSTLFIPPHGRFLDNDAQDEGPIILGAPVNLTDWMAGYDVPALEGAKLAVKQINEAGGVLGRELQIIELDGQTDPVVAGNVARELIDQGAEVILAPCDFDFGGAAASQAAQEAGLVGVSFCASSPLFGSEALGDKQFTLSMWNQTMSAAAAQFGIEEQGWTTAATIVDQATEYTQSLGDYFVETWTHLGGEVVSEDTYQQFDMTAAAQAQRILDLDEEPDVIFISTNMPDYGAIIADVRSAGITSAIMGGDAMDTREFYEVVGTELGHDIFISTHSFIGPEAGPAMEQFITDFEAEYGILRVWPLPQWVLMSFTYSPMQSSGPAPLRAPHLLKRW